MWGVRAVSGTAAEMEEVEQRKEQLPRGRFALPCALATPAPPCALGFSPFIDISRVRILTSTRQTKRAPVGALISLYGGERGIRTLDTGLPYTHFPGVLLQPLGHLSGILLTAHAGGPSQKRRKVKPDEPVVQFAHTGVVYIYGIPQMPGYRLFSCYCGLFRGDH